MNKFIIKAQITFNTTLSERWLDLNVNIGTIGGDKGDLTEVEVDSDGEASFVLQTGLDGLTPDEATNIAKEILMDWDDNCNKVFDSVEITEITPIVQPIEFNLVNFKRELAELLEKYNVTLDVNIDGDTHGISTNFVVSENKRGTPEHILNHYSSYIGASELRN